MMHINDSVDGAVDDAVNLATNNTVNPAVNDAADDAKNNRRAPMNNASPMLEVTQVCYAYPTATIRADFCAARAQSAALMGASGAGKSTILNLIAGLLHPHGGDVRIDGQSVLTLPPAQRPLTYLFQTDNLFAHLSVRQNIAIGLRPNLRLSEAEADAVDRALGWVALHSFDARKPGDLSGGQQQRVALARCFARCAMQHRPLLMLDEPFTGLDESLKTEMVELLHALQAAHSLTILIATHQQQDAERLRAKIVRV